MLCLTVAGCFSISSVDGLSFGFRRSIEFTNYDKSDE